MQLDVDDDQSSTRAAGRAFQHGRDQIRISSFRSLTDLVSPLLRSFFPYSACRPRRVLDREMPPPELVPLRRWLASHPALPLVASRTASSLRFSALRIPMGAVRRVTSVKCLPCESTLLFYRGRRPLKGGGRIAGASRSRQRMSRSLETRLTCHAGLHRSVRRPLRVMRRGSFNRAAFRYPRFYGQRGLAEGVRRIAPRLRLVRRRSWGSNAPFAVLTLEPGVVAFPRC